MGNCCPSICLGIQGHKQQHMSTAPTCCCCWLYMGTTCLCRAYMAPWWPPASPAALYCWFCLDVQLHLFLPQHTTAGAAGCTWHDPLVVQHSTLEAAGCAWRTLLLLSRYSTAGAAGCTWCHLLAWQHSTAEAAGCTEGCKHAAHSATTTYGTLLPALVCDGWLRVCTRCHTTLPAATLTNRHMAAQVSLFVSSCPLRVCFQACFCSWILHACFQPSCCWDDDPGQWAAATTVCGFWSRLCTRLLPPHMLHRLPTGILLQGPAPRA